MPWFWETWIHQNNTYYRFEHLQSYLAGEDWTNFDLEPVNAVVLSQHNNVSVFGTAGSGHALMRVDPARWR